MKPSREFFIFCCGAAMGLGSAYIGIGFDGDGRLLALGVGLWMIGFCLPWAIPGKRGP